MPIYQIHGTCIHGNMEICVYEHMISCSKYSSSENNNHDKNKENFRICMSTKTSELSISIDDKAKISMCRLTYLFSIESGRMLADWNSMKTVILKILTKFGLNS